MPTGKVYGIPLVTIVVVNWNGRKTIRACLRSIVNLSYPSYEVIVVDNGSTDGSVRLIEEEFGEVGLVKTGQNLGFARACNVGIKMARGDYVALVAGDICLDERWLAESLNLFNSQNVGIVGSTIYYQEPANVIWGAGGKIDLLTGQTWLLGAFNTSVRSNNVDHVTGGAILINSSVFRKIGLLDEDYFLYAEDLDFCLRAQRAGFVIRFAPEAKSWHLIRIDQERITPRVFYLRTVTEISVFFQHFPLIYLIPVSVYQVVVAPFFETFFFGQSVLCFKLRLEAFLANLVSLRGSFVKRKANQMLGQSRVKNRLSELFEEFRARSAARTYRH